MQRWTVTDKDENPAAIANENPTRWLVFESKLDAYRWCADNCTEDDKVVEIKFEVVENG